MKRWLKRNLPAAAEIRTNPHLGVFGRLLHDPNLWHLNRRSVSGATALGCFSMFLPFGQTLIAAAAAIVLRVNLPISVALVWVTNPVTIPPIYYATYRLGCWMLGIEPGRFAFEYWLDWRHWVAVIQPLMLGNLVAGTLCSGLGYLGVQWLWRRRLMRRIRERRERYRAAMSRDSRPSSSRQI